MLKQIEFVKELLSKQKAQCVQFTPIKNGIRCEFTDNKEDRRYSIDVKEIF